MNGHVEHVTPQEAMCSATVSEGGRVVTAREGAVSEE